MIVQAFKLFRVPILISTYALVSIVLVPTNTSAATLRYQNDFESGWGDVLFTGFCTQRGGDSETLFIATGDTIPAGHEQFARTTAQARKGTHSARVMLDPRYACYDNIGRFKLRSEIYMTRSWGSAYKFVDDVDHWYGLSIFVDASNTLSNPPYTIMTQIRADGGISNALKNTNGNWEYYFEGVSGGQSTGLLGAIEKGKWTDFVFHLRPSHNKNAIVEIWINGVQKYSRTGLDYTSTDPDGDAAIAHSGVYYGNYGENYPTYGDKNLPFIAYIDSVKIAQGPDGYALVAPSGTPAPGGTTQPPTPTTCQNTLTSSTAIPTGYGAAYNPLTTTKEYLVQASCTGTTQATVTVGNGNTTTYVYNKGYYYSGTTWTPYTLTCASGALIGGAWCPGRATASIPLPQNPQNVIAYTCQYTNSTWKCGCRDSACTTAYWQLQRVQR